MIIVDVIRNAEIINWNTINVFLNPPPEEENLKPDFKILISLAPDNINAGYAPASTLTNIPSKSIAKSDRGLNNTSALSDLPVKVLNVGISSILINTASNRVTNVITADSAMNWLNNCHFCAPKTFRIPISALRFADCAVDRFV